MKNLFFTICCLGILTACNDKQDLTEISTEQSQNQISISEQEKEKIYSFQKDNLSSFCQSSNDIICSIEETVKCALSPIQKYCDKKTMPDFIFYDDAMFADDGVTGRPTRQTFQIVKAKSLDGNTMEVLTKGECDKNWFGNCEGNIIYVLSNKTGKWKVKEIYAVEVIK